MLKNLFLATAVALLGAFIPASSAEASCSANMFSGSAGVYQPNPESVYVVGVTGLGDSFDVHLWDSSTGDRTTDNIYLYANADTNVTVSGVWGGPNQSTKVTSLQASGNGIRFNGVIGLVFEDANGGTDPIFSGNYGYPMSGDGLHSLQALPPSEDLVVSGALGSGGTIRTTNYCESDLEIEGNSQTVTFSSSDPGGDVAAVRYYVDNNHVATDSSAPFSYSFNSVNFTNGKHSVIAEVLFNNTGYVDHGNYMLLDNKAMAGGFYHRCQVDNGAAKCAGRNNYGQIGDNTTSTRNTLTQVQQLSSGVTQVSAGGYHSCAIRYGRLWCWGWNKFGQLGDQTTTTRLTPVSPYGMTSGVTAVAVGSYHTCAISYGTLKCWGYNAHGQVGQPSGSAILTPTTVPNILDVQMISAGSFHNCAMANDNSVQCWGYNYYGQLGNGLNSNTHVPQIALQDYAGAGHISMGDYHSCATTGTQPKCWGRGTEGELGNGSFNNSNVPVTAKLDIFNPPGNHNQSIASGRQTCVLTDLGEVHCWGQGNYGQMGNNTTSDSATPDEVKIISGVVDIGAGSSTVCAYEDNGDLYCWGRNNYGQTGNGNYVQQNVPDFIK